MPNRVSWQDQYIFSTQVDGQFGRDLFDRTQVLDPQTGLFGVKQNVFGWDVLGHPSLSNRQTFIDNRKAYGISQRYTGSGSKEFQQGVFEAGGSFEYQASVGVLTPWLWSLFQTGASSAAASGTAANTAYTFVPYSDPTVEMVNNVYRKFADNDTVSHRLGGCIAQSMQFTSGENDVVKVALELIAYDFSSTANFYGFPAITYDTTNVLLWQDCVVTLGGETVLLPSIDFTITNNASMKFYNNQYAQRFILGDLEGSGTIQIPWDAHPSGYTAGSNQGLNAQLTDFQNGTDKLLVMTWGGATEDNYLQISLNVRYQTPDVETGDNDEIRWSLPFITAYDGTYDGVTIATTEANTNRGIP